MHVGASGKESFVTCGMVSSVVPHTCGTVLAFFSGVLSCFPHMLRAGEGGSHLLLTLIGNLLFILTVGKLTMESSSASQLHLKGEK